MSRPERRVGEGPCGEREAYSLSPPKVYPNFARLGDKIHSYEIPPLKKMTTNVDDSITCDFMDDIFGGLS